MQETSAPPAVETLELSEILSALSYSLDLTEGQPAGHCIRGCWIGMHVGAELGLDSEQLHDLFYVLLLKDSGCSSNAARLRELYGSDDLTAKRDVKLVDVQSLPQLARFVATHVGRGWSGRGRLGRLLRLVKQGEQLATELISSRCTRGAEIAINLGFRRTVAAGVFSLDEHWNGKGRPEGLAGEAIPIAARIALLAQVVDVFHNQRGRREALREVRRRRGRWFDPAVVDAFLSVARGEAFWEGLAAPDLELRIRRLEPPEAGDELTEERLDAIALAFSQIIDAKSSFTAGHSARVADYAVAVGRRLGLAESRLRWLWRSALLHDIGKLGVSNSILDKPGQLDEREWEAMRLHPTYTEQILGRIRIFENMARVAAAHHERLDGTGYPKGLVSSEIGLDSRLITVADVYDALTADRPYRSGMPVERALGIMEDMRGSSLDGTCLDALIGLVASGAGEVAPGDGRERRVA